MSLDSLRSPVVAPVLAMKAISVCSDIPVPPILHGQEGYPQASRLSLCALRLIAVLVVGYQCIICVFMETADFLEADFCLNDLLSVQYLCIIIYI